MIASRKRKIAIATSTLIVTFSGSLFSTPAYAGTVRSAQWYLDYLHIAEAHQHNQGEGIIVAVIDSGVDATHPDLKGSVLTGIDLTAGGHAAGDDPRGWTDIDGHGTGMAGLIAAHGEALGVAPKAKVLPLRTSVEGHELGNNHVGQAIDWAVSHGAAIINLSIGSKSWDSALGAAIDRALEADVVVVAAVGNSPGDDTIAYPASAPGVLAAAGIDQQGKHAAVSVTGPQVVLAAPAVNIVSTGVDHGYRKGTGTSDAAAIISGAAALVRSAYPDLSAPEVIQRLTATADDKGPPGRDDEYGYGVLNIVKALTAPLPTAMPIASAVTAGSDPPSMAERDADSRPGIPVLGGIVLVAVLAAVGVTWLRRRH